MSFIFYLIISEPRGLVHYSNGRYDNGGYYNEVLQSYKRTGNSSKFLDMSSLRSAVCDIVSSHVPRLKERFNQ